MKLTVGEVAALLSTQEERVFDWIEDGSLPAQRVRGVYRINRSELLEWATERRVAIAPRAFAHSLTGNGIASVSTAMRAGIVQYSVPAADPAEAIRRIVRALPLADAADGDTLQQFLLARQAFGLAPVGYRIALPQVRTPVVLPVQGGRGPLLSVAFLDGEILLPSGVRDAEVDTIFLLVAPTVMAHLVLLATLTACVADDAFRDALARRAPRDELIDAARDAEERL